jgi:type IV secretion system protein VirB4
MLRLDKVIKPWKESAALNDHINLYGFWNETAFLTKSGDLGMVLSVPGVDYESLDRSQQEYAVKRLEAALKAFGPGQYFQGKPEAHRSFRSMLERENSGRTRQGRV